MKHLNLSSDLSFPPDLVTRKTVVYGLNGMGKSNLTLGKLPEELARLGIRFCILDLMGVAWGLQHGAKKGQQGIDVLILGGPHGDIEIEPTAGAVVADLVADESVSTIIDMSRQKSGKGWSKAEKIRFHADFYLRLYERQAETRRPILLIQDEAARVIPQTIPYGSPDLARCVGAIETMAEEGRALGVGMVFVTPRSARLNKSVAELAETMIAFRTVGPNSVDAVIDWLGQHVEKARHKDIVEKLRALPVGSALVVSPGWLGHEGIVRFHMRGTFDSTATPEPGVEVRAPGEAAKPDLAKYRARMAATIEKAKENDPAALKREVAALKAKLNALTQGIKTAAPQIERVEIPILKDGQIKRLEVTVFRAGKMLSDTQDAILKMGKLLAVASAKPKTEIEKSLVGMVRVDPKMPAGRIEIRSTEPGGPSAAIVNIDSGGISRPQKRILDALAQLKAWGIDLPDRRQVALLAEQSPSSSGYSNNLSALKTAGLIVYPSRGVVAATLEGEKLGSPSATASESAMREAFLSRVSVPQSRILRALIEKYPAPVRRDALADLSGQSSTSSGYSNNLSALKSLGVIEYPDRGHARASGILFIGGN